MITPQPKQEQFLTTDADIALYGGAAGGGKSFTLLLMPLYYIHNPKFNAVFFRRTTVDIRNPGGLWDESQLIYNMIEGSHSEKQSLKWTFPSGAMIKFAHLEHDSTMYTWQGSQINLLCCEINTKILMHDDSLKRIIDIKCGDFVKGMDNNNYKVIGNTLPHQKECIQIEFKDGSTQIHSSDHKFLTKFGWLSYEDVRMAYDYGIALNHLTKLCYYALKHVQYSHANIQVLEQLCDNSPQDFEQVHVILIEILENLNLLDFCAYKVQQSQETNCESSLCEHLKLLQQLLNHSEQEHQPPTRSIKVGNSSHESICNAMLDVSYHPLFVSWLYYYSIYTHQYDEQLHQNLKISLNGALQLNGVVRRNLKNQISDDEDNTRQYNPISFLYKHPYKGYEIQVDNPQIFFDALTFTPLNEKTVIDITVESSNYYITESGLINKNCFDELTHFSEMQFWYMISRNRSTSGIKPRVRMSTNPEKDSWVRKLVDWWIDSNGFPISERSGQIRYFVRENGKLKWADTKEELQHIGDPKSFTFISAKLIDNQELMLKDPGYLSNLMAQNAVERAKLLDGNWNISYSDFGSILDRSDFKRFPYRENHLGQQIFPLIEKAYLVVDGASKVKEANDYSVVGVFIRTLEDKQYYIVDWFRGRLEAPELEQKIIDMFSKWKPKISPQGIWIEDASVGTSLIQHLQRKGLPVFPLKPIKDKFLRLNDSLGIIKSKFVHIPEQADWVELFLEECEYFRGDLKHVIMSGESLPHDDQVDVLAYGVGNQITTQVNVSVYKRPEQKKRTSPIWNE